MMKKLTFISFVVLAVLSGCAKVTETSDGPTIFFAVGQRPFATRADEQSLVTYEDVTSFKSRAWLHAEGVPGYQEIFGAGQSEVISWDGSSEWSPSREYYWPKSSLSYIDFVSWYGNGTGNTAIDPTISYTWDSTTERASVSLGWTNFDATSGTERLLYADVAWRFNTNSALYHKDNAAVTGVPTLFHHALAKIIFRAISLTETAEDGTEFDVTVTGFSLSGVYTRGSMSLTNTDEGILSKQQNWTPAVPEWTSLANNSDPITVSYNPAHVVDTDEYTVFVDNRSVIPQSVEEKEVTLDYTVKTTYTSGVIVDEVMHATIPLSSFDGGITEWAAGTKYTYTINIRSDTGAITIVPEAKDWVPGYEGSVKIE